MSSADLLDVLSNGNQPTKVVCQFPKFFQAINTYFLTFPDGEDKRPHAVGLHNGGTLRCAVHQHFGIGVGPGPNLCMQTYENQIDNRETWFSVILATVQDKFKYEIDLLQESCHLDLCLGTPFQYIQQY